MTTNKVIATAVSVALAVSGCATASKDIAATYVSPVQYSSYDCEQLAAEAQRIQTRVMQLGGRLDQAASNDAGIMVVGLVLFWPALFALGGTKQQEAEFARLKGEYDAVEQASIAKKCARGTVIPAQTTASTQSPSTAAQPPGFVPTVATVDNAPVLTPASVTTPAPAAPAAGATPSAPSTSKYLISAERFAKDSGCLSAVASMNIKTPAYETFTVTCSNGDPRAIRCDDGVCRELR